MQTKGFIYILTNPSFKEYVKIGYAGNVETRLKQLTIVSVSPMRSGFMRRMRSRSV